MISSQESGRERLEGSMLAVCTDCRSMVLQVDILIMMGFRANSLQVIRSQGRSRRCMRGQRREECGL